MDTITQGLLGSVTAQLGFRQRIGRDATPVAFAAAVLPDLDIFIAPLLSLTGSETNEFTRLSIHRGLSHSLLAAPLLALPVALIWWRFRTTRNRKPAADNKGNKPPPFWLLYLCVFVAVLSHPLLDWCTSYGTQIFAPLTIKRYAIDAMPIVDIFYTPLLILTLLACWLVRKVGHGQKRRATLIIGWVGFALSVGYIATGRIMHDRAADEAVALAGKKQIVRTEAYPLIGTIFLWRAVVETDDSWIVARIHQFAGPGKQARFETAPKLENYWIDRARELDEAKTYDWFAMGRVRADYRQLNGLHYVELHDMRYGRPTESIDSLWPLVVTFDDAGRLLSIGRERRFHRGNLRHVAAEIWHDLWNP